jgi:hypothetical protein
VTTPQRVEQPRRTSTPVVTPAAQPQQEQPKRGAPQATTPRESVPQQQRGERAPNESREKKVWKVTTPENAGDRDNKDKERKDRERR